MYNVSSAVLKHIWKAQYRIWIKSLISSKLLYISIVFTFKTNSVVKMGFYLSLRISGRSIKYYS